MDRTQDCGSCNVGSIPTGGTKMSENNYFLTYKQEGITPLETLELLRHEKGIASSVPMTYAGRLDPMAEGLLLVLVGDECKKKESYLGLDKEYEVEVLLGLGSDTGDILGLIKEELNQPNDLSHELIKEKLMTLVGRRKEKYPAYSSRTVKGKPLFEYTRDGNLDDIEIPEKEIEIYSIEFMGLQKISLTELVESAINRIKKVKGDFRQDDIIASWQKIPQSNISNSKDYSECQIIKLCIKSSSGAYMRTLAEKTGQLFGLQALAWKIMRKKIGDYSLETKSF